MPRNDIAAKTTRHAMRLIAGMLAAGRLETIVTGIHHIPADGPVVLVARHYHHLFDGVALFRVVPRPMHIVVTLDWVRNRLVRRLMETATRLARWPVLLRADALESDTRGVRKQKDSVFRAADVKRYQRRTLRDCVELLAEGRILVFFPEGYPNIDPSYSPKTSATEFLPFKAGFAAVTRAAERKLGAAIPIIPAGLCYTRTERWIVRVNFGTPTYIEAFASRNLLLRYLESEVARLSGLA
jgi:putative membrane protein